MAFSIPKINYTGTIKEVTLGKGASAVSVGGEGCYPFYVFEGAMPRPPRIAFEVWDYEPEDWPDWAIEPYRDVISDPVAWAKKSIGTYGAQMIALLLKSADPNGRNRAVEEVVATVRAVSDAVSVPLIVWGCANDEKDAAMLRSIAEVCEGKNVALGPVSDKNYKQIGAMAIGYGHTVIASTPIDVNLAKQLNILITDMGQPLDRSGKLVSGSKRVVTDGLFAEAKDIVGGYSIVEAKDVDHAVALTEGCPIFAVGGGVEVRPLLKM